jgi:hypothetical protein
MPAKMEPIASVIRVMRFGFSVTRRPAQFLHLTVLMGGNGVVPPSEPARSLNPLAAGSPVNYKKWNRGSALVQLLWSKRLDGGWYRFNDVALSQLDPQGVFVIWLNGSGVKVSAVLYVGRGDLKNEFMRCRRDPLFRTTGLYVTWARVNDTQMLDSVAAYLYHQLSPMWGEAVSSPQAVPVNLPITA